LILFDADPLPNLVHPKVQHDKTLYFLILGPALRLRRLYASKSTILGIISNLLTKRYANKWKGRSIQMKKQWMQILVLLLLVVCLTRCATTMSDLVRSKEMGEGTSRIYQVSVDQAWEITKKVLDWEGIGALEDHRSEGYVLITSGTVWFFRATLIGIWVEPLNNVQSKVTVITKSKRSMDTFVGLSETDFHEHFSLFAKGVETK
jgi:hypothetical protein